MLGRYAKNMKSLTTIALSLIFIAVSMADDMFEKNKDVLDQSLYNKATVVVRVWVKSPGEGSKYHWVNTLNHATLKAPKGVKIPAELKVAHQSSGLGLPNGFATLYLEYYNPEKPELGWKLVERLNSKTKQLTKGYSHHSNDTEEK